jgi:hypothetical protein
MASLACPAAIAIAITGETPTLLLLKRNTRRKNHDGIMRIDPLRHDTKWILVAPVRRSPRTASLARGPGFAVVAAVFLALVCAWGSPGIPNENILVFDPGEQVAQPSKGIRSVLAALEELGHPATLADSKGLESFFSQPKGFPRLLVLSHAGALSSPLRKAIDEYLTKGGDLLLVGDPSSGLSGGAPLGGGVGRYFQFQFAGEAKGAPLLDPSASFDAGSLPGGVTAATSWSLAKSESAESSASDIFGRWINWLPTVRDGVPVLGSVASTWISGKSSNRKKVAVISHLGIDPQGWTPAVVEKLLGPILTFHLSGIALLNAGPDRFHYSPDATKFSGGKLLNRNATPAKVGIVSEVWKIDETVNPVRREQTVTIPAGEVVDWRELLPAGAQQAGDYRLQISLRSGNGRLLDRQNARFSVSKLEPTTPGQSVSLKDGRFALNGRPWSCHGVNYWLPQVAGQPAFNLWHEYLMPALYDPDQVDADLGRISRSGLNSVVVAYRGIKEAPALKDFLWRCKKFGLRCMAFVQNAHPIDYNLDNLEAMIRAADLDKQPALFALDLAWEPHFGPEQDRHKLDGKWRQWVECQYGSPAKVMDVWKFSPLGKDGQLRGPTDKELTDDGEWRGMVAAYRRFADDLISDGYGRVTRKIKSICPNVLVGARTGYGGTANAFYDNCMAYDLVSGADHLDYISPEAYGLFGDWSGFEDGLLITEMARYAGRQSKPVIWMEYGSSALAVGENSWSPALLNLEKQADYYRNMTRLIDTTQSEGSFAWWWVGGYRVDEKSDFGLIGVTGKQRPAFDVLAKGASSRVYKPLPEPDEWVLVDRDLHPRGQSMILTSNREKFLALARAGKRVGFRSPLDGLTTGNFPLVGVGDTEYRGTGPLKGLNGEIHSVEVTDSHETDGTRQIRLHVLNTGRVAWDSDPGSNGRVTVELSEGGKTIAQQPVPNNIPGGADAVILLKQNLAPGSYVLTLTSQRTGRFGSPAAFEVTSQAGGH